MSSSGELRLAPEAMRRLGYEVIDRIVEHYTGLARKPAQRRRSRAELEDALAGPLPRQPEDPVEVLDLITDRVFGSIGHMNHPRFFGFIPTPGNFASAMADAMASAWTPFCGTWLEGSGPAEIELIVLGWLREVFGLPEGAGGVFLSGGSIANWAALAVARDSKPGSDRHVLYCSDQTHASIDRAVRLLGYHAGQLRRLPADDRFRLDPRTLLSAVREDRAAGCVPLALVANAGTTNTGAVDPLEELADLCASEQLWLHTDGAYGAAAAFTPEGRRLLAGIERSDSLTLDPHKWLFQPYGLGCLLVRDANRLRQVFAYMQRPEYMQDTALRREEVNFCDFGPELTRPFRALKLWYSLKVFGADAFARAIEHGLRMAEFAERELRAAGWEIVSPAGMAIVAFRAVPEDATPEEADERNRRIAADLERDGCAFVSTTVLDGRTVLRLCTIQPTTTEEDVRLTVECLGRAR